MEAKPETIERRLGKWLGRNTSAEKIFTVEVLTEGGWAVGLRIEEDESKLSWAARPIQIQHVVETQTL